MISNSQNPFTKCSYEDPQIVAGYIKHHASSQALFETIKIFSQSLPGKRVLDLGCGPGHHAYYFAQLGYTVTGLDYSKEMIHQAQHLQKIENPPMFICGDMYQVATIFPKNSFDGIWIAASLLHIPEVDVPQILKSIHFITAPYGKIFVGLKEGKQGKQIIEEDKYGKPMEREFIFWEKDTFTQIAQETGFLVKNIVRETPWIRFFLEVKK